MSEYVFGLERGRKNYPETEFLYRMHYAEMRARLEKQGIPIGDYAPRLEQYFAANDAGWLLHFVVRCDGRPIGYANLYVTQDMHNGELIAQEDTIYVHPDHRNGVGRKLSLYILDDLRKRGVRRLNVCAMTDLRVAKLWERMGFRHTAHAMTYIFEDKK